jgi:hypothetical protein
VEKSDQPVSCQQLVSSKVKRKTDHRRKILDMDSSESQVNDKQEGSADKWISR